MFHKSKHNNIADFLSRINVDISKINSANTEDLSTEFHYVFNGENLDNVIDVVDINNGNDREPNDSIDGQTVHPQKEDLNNHFPNLDTIVK